MIYHLKYFFLFSTENNKIEFSSFLFLNNELFIFEWLKILRFELSLFEDKTSFFSVFLSRDFSNIEFLLSFIPNIEFLLSFIPNHLFQIN